jgi:hypothetical protein
MSEAQPPIPEATSAVGEDMHPGIQPPHLPSPAEEQVEEAARGGRLAELMAKYGPVALVTYLSIFAACMCGFAFAITQLGYRPEGVAASVGVWGMAWFACKVIQPVRIAATVVLTPFVAAGFHRLGLLTPDPSAGEEGAASAEPAEAGETP